MPKIIIFFVCNSPWIFVFELWAFLFITTKDMVFLDNELFFSEYPIEVNDLKNDNKML